MTNTLYRSPQPQQDLPRAGARGRPESLAAQPHPPHLPGSRSRPTHQLHRRARRNGRLHRPQRRRQDHHPQDAVRPAAPYRRRGHVAGYTPWERRHAYLRRISMVLGNKSQMLWDIPPLDTFRVLGEIYSVPAAEYRQTLDELVDAAGDARAAHQAGAQPLAGRAHEMRAGRRAAAPPGGALSRRADPGAGRVHADAAAPLPRATTTAAAAPPSSSPATTWPT